VVHVWIPRAAILRLRRVRALEAFWGFVIARCGCASWLEAYEIFQQAMAVDERCRAFANMWHLALSWATAISIHLDGPVVHIAVVRIRGSDRVVCTCCLHEMVKGVPLQLSFYEVIPTPYEIAIIGAGVNVGQARRSVRVRSQEYRIIFLPGFVWPCVLTVYGGRCGIALWAMAGASLCAHVL